jgi:hypothetical protein
MLWEVSFFTLSTWCSKILLYLDNPLFLLVGDIVCYYFIEYVTNAFSMHIFSSFYTNDS